MAAEAPDVGVAWELRWQVCTAATGQLPGAVCKAAIRKLPCTTMQGARAQRSCFGGLPRLRSVEREGRCMVGVVLGVMLVVVLSVALPGGLNWQERSQVE